MQPIRRIIMKELLLLFGLLAVASAGLAWLGINRILDEQIEIRSHQDLDKLAQEIRRDLADVERVGVTAANWWQAGELRTDQLDGAEIHLASLLEAFPSIANLVFISMDGWGLSMSRLPEGMSSYRLDARKDAALKQYLRKRGRVLGVQPWEPTTYKVFERPWFEGAAQGTGPHWVGAYPFANRPVHGLSYVLPLKDAAGRFQGALCVDIFLDSLSERTWQVQPTAHSLALVSDGLGRAIILPKGVDSNPAAVKGSAFLTPISPSFLPLFDSLLNRWKALGRPSHLFRLRSQGAGYTCINQRLQGVEGAQWNLSLAVPDSDYLGKGRRLAIFILLAGGLASTLAIWRAMRLARGVSVSLEDLALSAQALGKGTTPEPAPSRIQEIQTLGEALHRAGLALEMEAELQAKLQHSQRLETVGTLTGGIAHDVNNQLAAILGQINLGMEDLGQGHPALNRLVQAEEATRRCAGMIRSLLGFTHKAKPELRRVDLNQLASATGALVEGLLGGRIRLELDLDPQQPAVQGEQVSLEQVLMNLAVNGRDAMPEGGTLRLATRALGGGEALLSVRDAGEGIPQELLPKIFDPFFTTKEVGKGTGLGLAMVASIVKAHGGRIEVDSRLGEGTEFRIYLAADESAPKVGATPPPARPPKGSLAGFRILVVDDEAPLRRMLSDALSMRQAQVDCASNGVRAWEAWQEATYDLLLTDQRMGGMTGLELVAKLRETGSPAPVILASGFGLEGLEALVAQDEHLHVIPKPFDLRDLFRLIEGLLLPSQHLQG